MKYVPPYTSSDPDAGYVNGNPATGVAGSIPPAAAFEHPQREILKVITQAGLTPDEGDLTQLWQAIAMIVAGAVPVIPTVPSFASIAETKAGVNTTKIVNPEDAAQAAQSGTWNQAAAAGTANAITATLAPAPGALSTRMEVNVTLAATNTSTAVTFNLNGLGAKTVLRADGSAPPVGFLASGTTRKLIYNGTNWRDFTPAFGSASLSGSGYYRFPDGLTLQWGNGTTSSGVGNITFPIAFSSAPYAVMAMDSAASSWSTSNASFLGFSGYSATGVTAQSVTWNGSAMTRAFTGFAWFAIGPT